MAFDVAHIISSQTPRAALDQLALICEPYDKIISLGTPLRKDFPAQLETLQVPFNLDLIAKSKLAKAAHFGSILHVWSEDLVEIAAQAAREKRAKVLYSAPSVTATSEENKLPWLAGSLGVTITTPTRAGLNLCLNLNADPSKFAYLPLAWQELDSPAQMREKIRKALKIDASAPVITLPDDMTLNSGHKLAIWAHAIISWVHKGAKLLLPGYGPMYKNLHDFAEGSYFLKDVYFTKDRFSTEELIAASDICIFAGSRSQRNYPRLIQACAANRACIAVSTIESKELAPADSCALLVQRKPRDIASAMLKLVENSDLRQQLSQAAQKHVQETLIRDKTIALRDEIYEKLRPISK